MRTRLLTSTVIVLLAGGGSLRAQSISVDDPGVCLMCHSELEEAMDQRHVHSILEGGKCSSCHNPHASSHAALLNDGIGELCLSCHEDVAHEASLAVGHEPVADGNCLACHDPHASEHADLMVQPTADLCGACHSSVNQWMARSNIHAPVAARECLSCHTAHGSEHGGLLSEPIPGQCFGCHENTAAFRQVHQGYDVTEANCLTCHDPHSSPQPNLVMANEHAPFAGGQCSACHDGSAGGSGFALVSDVKSVCTRCHDDIREEAAQPYTHNLNDERSCMNCHNAHTSSADALLARPQQTMCMQCHFKGDEYTEDSRESLLTHDGMECTSCHVPHGSSNPQYFVAGKTEMCAGCHERAHRSSHPIGPEVIDPKTGEQVTCLSCHQLHGADFEPYLPLSPEMDLCIQCHRR